MKPTGLYTNIKYPQRSTVGAWINFSIFAICLLFFIWFAQQVLTSATLRFDFRVRNVVHQLATPAATSAMKAASLIGSAAFLAALTLIVCFLFVRMARTYAAAVLIVVMGGAFAMDVVLKRIFHRMRPIAFFGVSPHSFSFPSGHALDSFCFYSAIVILLSSRTRYSAVKVILWIIALGLIFVIGVSRVYLGVHYPTDVIGGYLLALIWLNLVWAVKKQQESREQGLGIRD